jgi:hypothetical protein
MGPEPPWQEPFGWLQDILPKMLEGTGWSAPLGTLLTNMRWQIRTIIKEERRVATELLNQSEVQKGEIVRLGAEKAALQGEATPPRHDLEREKPGRRADICRLTAEKSELQSEWSSFQLSEVLPRFGHAHGRWGGAASVAEYGIELIYKRTAQGHVYVQGAERTIRFLRECRRTGAGFVVFGKKGTDAGHNEAWLMTTRA